ncbi:flagellar hook-basal body complex protein FliE [Pseudobutyrivibrio sp.]|uniref:flagellar hook-basal body complex protein FliE n=1 Tax=Pseudobutyrivibrio sp. TaxID=2014367 RepID=UPI001B472A04|nr:flagellar hook-basal body complex protein FliE [Pseudobutyrivibrio sp.]MBP5593830.1 flagellar hook-basal body complex protein FliE [Pseudobutyrivibrio sp.]MBQ7470619.1 flagellar hook-basal body complex protein FliE [Pseudobutyrivibrio sp.]MBR5650468.1 flagellar hook-basal body complex protein FliE [Pseudobutyrivibrio sp.]
MDVNSIQGLYGATPVTTAETKVDSDKGFQSMLDSVMALLEDTNSAIKTANREQVAFALGETDNTHDLMIAEQKANIALQYTVAVRDKVLEAYQQIMQMQV